MANIYGNRLPQQTEAGDYDLPDQRYLQVGAPPVSANIQGPAAMGQPQDNLAEVEGMTGDYYNTYGKLKSYTEGLWKDFGVDASKPDYSQPGGGTAFKTFQKLQANLMHTSNKLGNYLKEQNQMRPAIAAHETVALDNPNGDPTQPLYVSTKNSPELTHAATVADVLRNSPDESHRADIPIKEVKDSFYKKWQDALAKGDHAEAEYWGGEYLKASHLHSQYSTIKTDLLDEKEKQRRARVQGAPKHLAVLREFVPLAKGDWAPGSYKVIPDPLDPEKTIAINRAHEGEKLGKYTANTKTGQKEYDRILDGWVKNEDGSVEWRFKSPAEGVEPPPPERVDNQGGFKITSAFQAANPTFGKTTDTATAIDATDLADYGNQDVDYEKLMDYGAPAGTGGYKATQSFGHSLNQEIKQTGGVTKAKRQLSKELDAELGEGWTGDKKTLKLPDGSEIILSKKFWNGNYKILDKKDKKIGEISKEDLVKMLDEKGYFGGASKAPASSEVPQIHSQEEYDALAPGSQYIDTNGKKAIKKK